MENVWRKLKISILESPAFSDPEALKVYIYCLSKTAHKTAFVTLQKGRGKITITIQPGQMVWGRNKAAAFMNLSPSKCERLLKFLEKKAMVLRQPYKNFTLVSIIELTDIECINENSELQVNLKRTSNELQMNTYKSIKSIKIKEEREAPAPEGDKPQPENEYTGGGKIALSFRVRSLFINAGGVCTEDDMRHFSKIAYSMRDIIKQSNPNGGRPSDDKITEAVKAVFELLPDWVKAKGFFSPSGIARNISGIVNEIRANKRSKLEDKAKDGVSISSFAKRPNLPPKNENQ